MLIQNRKNYVRILLLPNSKSAKSLVPGGHLLIDYGYTAHPEKWYDNPAPNLVWEGTDSHGNFGKMMLPDSKFDQGNGICSFVRRYEITCKYGMSIVRNIPTQKHFATLRQIQEWLLNFGFSIEGEWGDYERNPLSEETTRAMIWAKNNG